jgi:hypothetical protein
MTQVPLLETQHTAEFLVSYANGHRSFDRGTLIAGQNLSAGAVLGQIKLATPAAPAMVGTGNAVMSAITLGATAQSGSYVVTFTGATAYTVTDPSGNSMPPAAALGAYTNADINWTITAGGTPAVAGDKFTVVVAAGSGKYTSYLPTAVDGSGVVAGVLYQNTNATSADVKGTVVTRQAEVNASELKWDATVTGGALTTGIAGLAALGIIAR